MVQPKDLQIQYYALLREQSGTSFETVQSAAETAGDLYQELAQRHKFSLRMEQLRVAINDQFANWETQVQNQDVVVFIPPVAGG